MYDEAIEVGLRSNHPLKIEKSGLISILKTQTIVDIDKKFGVQHIDCTGLVTHVRHLDELDVLNGYILQIKLSVSGNIHNYHFFFTYHPDSMVVILTLPITACVDVAMPHCIAEFLRWLVDVTGAEGIHVGDEGLISDDILGIDDSSLSSPSVAIAKVTQILAGALPD